MNYLFAFSYYNYHTPVYAAVKADYSLFKSTNWEAFFKETKCYCDPLKMLCKGEYKKDPDAEIYTNRSFSLPFIINSQRKSITVLKDEDIEFYDHDVDPEAKYLNACASWMERDSY